jgi:branched-chain amino acid aminotransferase
MFILNYDDGQGWHDARIVPYEPLAIDPSAMVFHYAQSVFEGLKCYRATDGRLLLFRPQMNFKRLNASSDRLCIPPLDEDFALRALCELITVDADWAPGEPDTSLYVRPFIIATEPALGVHPAHNYLFMIILSPVGPYYKEGLNPVKIVIEDEYVRAVRGGIGFTKGSANYAASLKGQEKAEANGFTQVLWLDGIERKYIEEVGTMNVFFLINGEVVTPELTGSILPGITRDSVISLLKHWGITVTQRRISAAEIIAASENGSLQEAFGSGTAAVISPIGSLSRGGTTVEIAEGKTGTLSRRLYEQLTGIQYGKSDDPFGWSYDVTSYDVTSGAVKS